MVGEALVYFLSSTRMNTFFKRVFYVAFVLVVIIFVGGAAAFMGYYFGSNKTQKETSSELQAKFDKDEADIKSECSASKDELKSNYQDQIKSLQGQVADLEKRLGTKITP